MCLTFSGTHPNAHSFFTYYDEAADLLKNIEDFDQDCQECSRELQDQWFWKFHLLAEMNLDHLVLDFRNAFSLMGEFLGVKVAREFRKFAHGLPRLEIKAPSKRLEKKIYDIVVGQNEESN